MNNKWNFEELKRANDKLNLIFGFSFQLCQREPLGFGVYLLDEWLHKEKGYDEEKDGSMGDFIEKNYGKDVKEFVEECIIKC